MKNIVQNNQGFSLIEIIASLVIFTILLTSFLSLYLSTAQTTRNASDSLDYTLIAQKELEKIYNLVKLHSPSERDQIMTSLGYSKLNNEQYERTVTTSGVEPYVLSVAIRSYTSNSFSDLNDKLSYVKVSTSNSSKTRSYSVMESLVEWGRMNP